VTSMTSTLRQAWVGLRLLLVMTVLLGVLYPFAVFVVGRVAPGTSDGSYVTASDGTVVGSALIGQQFEGAEWFHPRPSVAGDGYDPLASGGSNLGPDNPDLVAAVTERIAAVAADNGVDPGQVPPDAVTASGSGLDPHISPEYAEIQVARVARERGLDAAQVRALVVAHTSGRVLGFIGEPAVDVLELNLALSGLA
jgi:potassium-transporting ATPase KdpC subunit